jgi:hypothetical protein
MPPNSDCELRIAIDDAADFKHPNLAVLRFPSLTDLGWWIIPRITIRTVGAGCEARITKREYGERKSGLLGKAKWRWIRPPCFD